MALRVHKIVARRQEKVDDYTIMWDAIKLAFTEGKVVVVEHRKHCLKDWIIDPIEIRNNMLAKVRKE